MDQRGLTRNTRLRSATRRRVLGGALEGMVACAAGVAAVGGATQGHAAPARQMGKYGEGFSGDWDWVRGEFAFAPGLAYLNSGSEGSLPRQLQIRLAQSVEKWSASPSQAFFSDPLLDQAQTVNRRAMAAFINASAEDVVLTDNTTMGLAMVLMGFPFAPGDEVVTTTHEHYALLSPLKVLSERIGIKVVEVPLQSPAQSEVQIVEGFRTAITARTRAFCFSHVNWTTGLRMPVSALCALARTHRIASLIDGAHGLGMLNLDMQALGCDFYSCAGHKWFNGPPGTGLLYLREAKANPWQLVPILSEGALLLGPSLSVSDALQMRGSTNGPAFLTLAEGADFERRLGKDAIEIRILSLAAQVRNRASAQWGEGCLFSPSSKTPTLCSGLTAFVPSRDPRAGLDPKFVPGIAKLLVDKFNIWTRATSFPADPDYPGEIMNVLRVSTNIFNNSSDIDRLFAAIGAIVRRAE